MGKSNKAQESKVWELAKLIKLTELIKLRDGSAKHAYFTDFWKLPFDFGNRELGQLVFSTRQFLYDMDVDDEKKRI